ncbi:MFS transporter [Gordonia sp. MP11Mi]|uniref:Drug efflux pump JefA n=1 Tax=Gordonia sp. MP11Mi TaxID=3022769 RepID=A0AA97CX05_9ACTN
MTDTTPRWGARRRITLAVVCAATAMLMLDIAVVNTALPAISLDFAADLGALKWVIDGYTLALAATVLSAGAWADRVGRRRVFIVGAIVFTVSSVLCASADRMAFLNAARVAQGLGASLLFATSLALLAHAFDDGTKARTTALAAYGATIGAAFAVGPLLGGVLTEWVGWRGIFLINVPVGALMLAALRWIDESRSAAPRRGDWLGQLTAIVALAALTGGFFEAADNGWSAGRTLVMFALAVAALVAFVAVEVTVAEPMLPLGLFATRAFAGAQLATFSISASMFAVFVYVTLYLQGVLGMSPIQAGLVYLPGTAMMLVVAGATDKLMNVVAPRTLITLALFGVAGGMAWMTVASVDSSGWNLVPGFLLACVGAGVFNPVLSAIVLSESDSDDVGLATGVNDVFRQSGIALGVAALGAVFPAQSAFTPDSAQEFTDALVVALWISCAVALAGAFVAAATLGRASLRPVAVRSEGLSQTGSPTRDSRRRIAS